MASRAPTRKPSPATSAKARGPRPARKRSTAAVAITVGVAVLLVITLVWWLGWGSRSDDSPATSVLPAGTGMGAVELYGSDLGALTTFYSDGVGLSVLSESEEVVELGLDGAAPLLVLHRSDAGPDDRTQAGLYHSAFLFEDAGELAAALVRTSNLDPTSFQGSSDHRVSEAFYFGDPEGNGVELYLDRPEQDWEWSDGQVTMGSAALDPNAFVSEHLLDTMAPPTALSMGHVHLRGGSLAQAETFYADVLGFAVTARSDGALFFAADGYHHHVAVNIWSSSGARLRPESLGLHTLTVHVPDEDALTALGGRLAEAEVEFTREGERLITSDPWRTRIVVSVDDTR